MFHIFSIPPDIGPKVSKRDTCHYPVSGDTFIRVPHGTKIRAEIRQNLNYKRSFIPFLGIRNKKIHQPQSCLIILFQNWRILILARIPFMMRRLSSICMILLSLSSKSINQVYRQKDPKHMLVNGLRYYKPFAVT